MLSSRSSPDCTWHERRVQFNFWLASSRSIPIFCAFSVSMTLALLQVKVVSSRKDCIWLPVKANLCFVDKEVCLSASSESDASASLGIFCHLAKDPIARSSLKRTLLKEESGFGDVILGTALCASQVSSSLTSMDFCTQGGFCLLL